MDCYFCKNELEYGNICKSCAEKQRLSCSSYETLAIKKPKGLNSKVHIGTSYWIDGHFFFMSEKALFQINKSDVTSIEKRHLMSLTKDTIGGALTPSYRRVKILLKNGNEFYLSARKKNLDFLG